MYVIEVIPLIRGTKIDTLSYFSGTEYCIGTFLSVPIRKKLQRAIVTAVHPVAEAKNNLRAAAFALQKLPPQTELGVVPESVRKTTQELTKRYPCTEGAILFQLLPPEVRDGTYQFPAISSLTQHEETTPRVLTATRKDRFVTYRSHIRSVLAKRGSVLFVVPTSAEVPAAVAELTQGIEDRIVQFSATQTPKQRKAAYEDFEDTSLAKLIITTPSHAYLDRVDLLSIVIESEASEHYQSRIRPYLDHRTALMTHAKTTGRSIILGDILPRPEIETKRRQEFYSTEGEETKRIVFSAPLSIIEQKTKPLGDVPFSLLSPELKTRISTTTSGRGRVFLYSARRGLAPVVACIDCGFIFRCPDSGTPYSLLRTHSKTGTEARWFISSTSGKRIKAADTCTACGSWRLRERGIGIQSVADECTELFPNHKIIVFDHLSASTHKRATALMAEFYKDRGTILIGTHITLPYLYTSGVELSAVVSFDATRANPTWRADENSLRLLLTLREFSEKEVLLQTRQPIDQLLTYAQSGTIEGFYTEELALRQSLAYPPETTFFLLTWQGTKEVTENIEAEIKKRTPNFTASFYSNPLSTSAKTLRHALFRIKTGAGELPELVQVLRYFPPYIKIEVNPSRIV